MKKRHAFRLFAPVLLCGAAAGVSSAAGQAGQPSMQPLLEKAHALEVRGRMDMAAQTWQQVLLADPNNTEALGGMARATKLSGNLALSQQYLDRLRAINPNDPAIARVGSMGTQQDLNAQLRQAGRLAQQGQNDQAMAIYRQAYGNTPPMGEAALGYYETESATDQGRAHAIEGLRALAAKYPADNRYQIALGRLLTYNPKTRAEGRRMLAAYPSEPKAVEAYRQSLLFDVQNPAAAGEIRAYLARHNDVALADAFRARNLPASAGGPARPTVALSPAERAAAAARNARLSADQAAYRSLNAHQLEEAEQRFKGILAKNPENADALAGMGYIRMQQSNFAGALSFFSQAKQDGSKDRGLDTAIATSRFWNTMGEGGIALNANDLPLAEKNYRAALSMRPDSPEALEALGGTLLKMGQPEAAIPYFTRYAQLRPAEAHAWRGLFLSQYGAGHVSEALNIERQMPAPVVAQLARDPLYLSGLASAYSSAGREVEAQRVLKAALDLPFPADAKGVELDTQLQYADILQAAHRQTQAAGLYRQILTHDANNTLAWEGLVRAQHQLDEDPQAIQTIEAMPAPSYAQAMRDPGFNQTVASIYQGQRRYDVAQDLLEKALARQAAAGQKPSASLQIQLAGVYLLRKNPAQAFPLYKQVLSANPSSTDAWKGLLSALHETGHDQEALSQAQRIPVSTRTQLENDPAYLQTIASVYSALGQPREASLFLRRVEQQYAAQRSVAPAEIAIQNAWLLYNVNDGPGLYQQLMMLGDRDDLTVVQRKTVQTIWANLAVERANRAVDRGEYRKALDILNATDAAFPDNPEVPKLLSGAYARAGASRQAVDIWKAQDLTDAPAADYRSAVGAALAANDSRDAETWLRFGLKRYPQDSQLLTLAARFEEARGDAGRAVDFYDAALMSMPAPDPGSALAGELGRPDAAVRTGKPRADLAGILRPSPTETEAVPNAPAERPPLYLPGFGNSGATAPVPFNSQGAPSYQDYGPQHAEPVNPPSPAAPQTMPPAFTPQGTPSTLREYVPQASFAPDMHDRPSRRQVEYASQAEGSTPILTPAVFHQQHAVRITSEPQSDSQSEFRNESRSSASMTLQPVVWQQQTTSSQTTTTQQTTAGQATPGQTTSGQAMSGQANAQQQGSSAASKPSAAPPAATGEQYGPYVPYVPPAVQPVQLGAPTAPAAAKPEVTDVLPTAHYVPNAHGDGGATGITGANGSPVQADITPSSTTATHRRQSRTAARSGQSQPSGELIRTTPTDPIQTPPTQPVEYLPYNPALQNQNGSLQNGQAPSGQVTQPGVSSQVPQQNGTDGGYGQQYPQPNTRAVETQPVRRTHNRVHPTPRRAAVPSATPAPAPATATPMVVRGMSYPGIQQPLDYQPYPMVGPAYPLGNPPSDYDLMQQRLPPLRGRYYTGNLPETQVPLTEREQTERAIDQLEASYSGWLGGTGSARYRSGTPGVDRLTDVETSFEATATVGNRIRFSVVPKAVFLNSGNLDTTSSLNPNPVLGTLPGNAANPPQQQSANGIGGEFQVATRNFAAAVGYTPYEFLVRNVTGRVLYRAGQHFTFFGDRSPVTETQLSYAGLRDPGSVSPVYAGNIWGGVVSTGGGVRFDTGNERAGFYISVDGADLTGYHVLQNNKFEGSAGAYFLAHTFPGYGRLNVGASLFGMHYASNERPLTYGLGGYFSPGAYLLASVPVTFAGRYQNNFHYAVQGSVGVQTFTEDSQVYFPLDRGLQSALVCTTLQVATGVCGRTPSNSNTGGNYSINAEGAYRIADHWYAGGFLTANNTNNYNTVTGGFFVRYVFRQQFATEEYPTGLFPVDGFRPLRVP